MSSAKQVATTGPSHTKRRGAVAALCVIGIGLTGLVYSDAAAAARPATTVTDRNAVVSAVTVNNGPSNFAVVSTGQDVTVVGKYQSTDTSSNIDQIEIGWAGSSAPLGCIYNGVGQHRGTFSFDLGAAPSAGVNEVIINFAQDFSCDTSGWFNTNTGPAIAEIPVTPPASGQNGPDTLTNVQLNGTGTNAVVVGSAKSVTVSGNYVVNDSSGSPNQIEVGWAGSSAPTACAFNGGPQAHGRFKVNLGVPPNVGANYVVYHYGQDFECNLNGWWGGSGNPPNVTVVGLYYNSALPH